MDTIGILLSSFTRQKQYFESKYVMRCDSQCTITFNERPMKKAALFIAWHANGAFKGRWTRVLCSTARLPRPLHNQSFMPYARAPSKCSIALPSLFSHICLNLTPHRLRHVNEWNISQGDRGGAGRLGTSRFPQSSEATKILTYKSRSTLSPSPIM